MKFTIKYFHLDPDLEYQDSSYISHIIPPDYLDLLNIKMDCCNDSVKNKLYFIETVVSKYRNPVSRFNYDKKYYLQVYKIDTSFSYSLKDKIKDNRSNAYTPFYDSSSLDDRTAMKFLYKDNKPPKAINIYFDLYGDSTFMLKKNDTIAYYYSKCKNFSIKFSPNADNDIYSEIKSKSIGEAVSLEIIFLKKNRQLYMFTLSAKDAFTNLQRGTLYNLIYKKRI